VEEEEEEKEAEEEIDVGARQGDLKFFIPTLTQYMIRVFLYLAHYKNPE
jgi:hypothetical protein